MAEPKLPPKSVSENQSVPDATGRPAEQPATAQPEAEVAAVPLPPYGQKAPYHCEITYKQEKDWWDEIKPFIEIAGIILLAVYTGYTIKMYCANKKSANAATDAAKTARDALVQSQRPWIKIKHRIVKPFDFTFVGAAGPAATMTVEDTIENVGSGVALDVVSWEDVIPLDPNVSTDKARRRQDQWCGANKTYDPHNPTQLNGYILFPRDPFVQDSHIGPLMKDVDQAVRDNILSGNPMFGEQPGNLRGKVAFAMVGCVVYRSSLDPEGTRPHVTGFLYHLGEVVGDGVGIQPFIFPKGIANTLQLLNFLTEILRTSPFTARTAPRMQCG